MVTAPQGVVWKAMVKKHGKVFAMAGIVKLVHDCIMFLGPFVLEQLLKFLENGGSPCKQLQCTADTVYSLYIAMNRLAYFFRHGSTPCTVMRAYACV